MAFVFGEEEQQVIFLRLERQRRVVEGDFAAGDVDRKVAEGEHFLFVGGQVGFDFFKFFTDDLGAAQLVR